MRDILMPLACLPASMWLETIVVGLGNLNNRHFMGARVHGTHFIVRESFSLMQFRGIKVTRSELVAFRVGNRDLENPIRCNVKLIKRKKVCWIN